MSNTFIFIPRDDEPGSGAWINLSHVSYITETPKVITIHIGVASINVRNDEQIISLKQYLSSTGKKQR
jgi:hypothetical protein